MGEEINLMLCYNIPSYIAYLKMSDHKHLLVEGQNDVRFFELFFNRIQPQSKIVIDCADMITNNDSSKILGNREKIESISLNNIPNLLCFVDREFRKFQYKGKIIDCLRKHHSGKSLIWSRGHSIENYCFSIDVFESPLRSQTTIPEFNDALIIFKNCFDEITRIAVLLTLFGIYTNNFIVIIHYLNEGNLEFDYSKKNFFFNKQEFLTKALELGLVFNYNDASEMIDYWIENIKRSDFSDLTWFCHGHIGFSAYWNAYRKILSSLCLINNRTDKEAKKLLRLDESQRFYCCLEEYMKNINNEELVSVIKSKFKL